MITKYNQGQTLVESLAALAISIVIISGMVVAVNMSLKATRLNRTKSYATKLSQDGIEIVRNLKSTTSWSTFVTSYTSGVVYCLKDDTSNTISPKVNPDDCILSNQSEKFQRTATFTPEAVAIPQYIKVNVQTWYLDGSTWVNNKSSNATIQLANWK